MYFSLIELDKKNDGKNDSYDGLSLKQSEFASVVFIGLSPARSDIPIIYHKNQPGVVLVNDWFISQ